MRRPIIVGNWKMNTLGKEAEQLAKDVAAIAATFADKVDVGVAPPAIWLERVIAATTGRPCLVYAQNVGPKSSGALTGEISAQMAADAKADGTLVGHSERRTLFGETDADTAAKLTQAQNHGLKRILCVGETLDERESGLTWDVVQRQLSGADLDVSTTDGLVIAYEPVWAIGTGRTATPDQAQDVHARIRTWLDRKYGETVAASVRIQYGGSVKPANAAELLAQPDIDGALVGGASLKADSFRAIVEAAAAMES